MAMEIFREGELEEEVRSFVRPSLGSAGSVPDALLFRVDSVE